MEQNNQNQEKQDINPNILENKIKSGNFSWAEASAYNKMVWNKTAARDLALSSKEAISSWNLKTTINPQEARIVQKSWVIGEEIKQWNVRADVTDTTPEKFTQEFKQTPTPKVPKLAPDMTKTAEELWLWWKTPESATITPREEAPVDFTKIQTVADWKKQTWWWIDNLDSWIEAKYWTIANKNPDWSLTATINGQDYNWIIDDAGNPIRTQLPPSSASIFDSLKTWVEISQDIQNTNEYKKALQRYQAYNQYANLNANQLASAISSWDLLPWTQVYKDLEANPETKIELNKAQSLNIINWKTVDTTNAWINLTNKITNDSTIANYMSDNNISSDEFNSMVNTPDVVEKAKEVEQYAMKVNDLKATYEDIRRQTEEQFKWTGATKVAIEALIAQRQKDILPALNLAISNYNTSFWTYTDLKNSAIDLFKTNLGLYQQAQAQQQAQQATQTQYDNQVKLLQLQQQYKDIPTSIITDAATGQQQLINTQTWDVIASYDTGLSTTTSKPTLQNFGTSDKPDWRQYNSTTWQWETPSWVSTTWTVWNYEITSWTSWNRPDRNNNPWNLKMWDVWYWVDDQNHTIFWSASEWYQALMNDIQAKLTWNTRTWLTPESTLSDLWKVYAEDPNWSNSVSKISWYALNTKLKDIDVNKLAPAIAKQEWFTWTISLQQESEPLTPQQFTQSNQIITSFKSDPQVKSFEEAYSQWLNLLTSLWDKTWPWDVAAIFQFMKTLDPQSVVRESEFEVAAKSAWVWEYVWNTWDRLNKWKKLTDMQAKAFGELAQQFILNKAKLYDTKYQDWIRRLERQWIDTSIFPTSVADEMRQYLSNISTGTTTIPETSWNSIKDLTNKYFWTTDTWAWSTQDINSLYSKYYGND